MKIEDSSTTPKNEVTIPNQTSIKRPSIDSGTSRSSSISDDTNVLPELLDKLSNSDGFGSATSTLKNGEGNPIAENLKDVKHSESKRRDRLLSDGVLLELIQKSDAKGFVRLFTNLSIMALTVITIRRLDVIQAMADNTVEYPVEITNETSSISMLVFIILYFFYGFQIQCFAFAGQHEFLHRSAFKTKWLNDICLFYTGVFCFECGEHERLMHKQHHTFTNNIDRDPELTSFYGREELSNSAFRVIPSSRLVYFLDFINVLAPFRCRLGRIINSARGIPVDYSGFKWSLKEDPMDDEVRRHLQRMALLQVLHYVVILALFGKSYEGRQKMLFWWIIPVLIGYPVVNFFRNLEHADCEVSKVPNCLLNTRSVRSNAFVRMLLWDTNFHAEHHCYAMVPFFNLHKLNELMRDHVLHNECNHFTSQNWECFKWGGWIDQQREEMEAMTEVSIDSTKKLQ